VPGEDGTPDASTEDVVLDKKYFSLNVVTSEIDYDLILDKTVVNSSIKTDKVNIKIRKKDSTGTSYVSRSELNGGKFSIECSNAKSS
jgi:hypothetical protein